MEIMIKTAVAILCSQCQRRKSVCDTKNPPTLVDAYRCKYDEAQELIESLDILAPKKRR